MRFEQRKRGTLENFVVRSSVLFRGCVLNSIDVFSFFQILYGYSIQSERSAERLQEEEHCHLSFTVRVPYSQDLLTVPG